MDFFPQNRIAIFYIIGAVAIIGISLGFVTVCMGDGCTDLWKYNLIPVLIIFFAFLYLVIFTVNLVLGKFKKK